MISPVIPCPKTVSQFVALITTEKEQLLLVVPYAKGFKKGTPIDPIELRGRRKRIRSRMNKDAHRNVVELS